VGGLLRPYLVRQRGQSQACPYKLFSPSAQVRQFEATEEEKIFGSSITAEGAGDEIEKSMRSRKRRRKPVRDIRRARGSGRRLRGRVRAQSDHADPCAEHIARIESLLKSVLRGTGFRFMRANARVTTSGRVARSGVTGSPGCEVSLLHSNEHDGVQRSVGDLQQARERTVQFQD
jgi:hypothetical protein